MQHKEEGRKPAGGCIASRQGVGFFFYGAVQQQAAGGAGYPLCGVGRGVQGAQPSTNMFIPPANTKIKFTHPPMQGHAEKTDRFPKTKMI